jgi:hypothetical protein
MKLIAAVLLTSLGVVSAQAYTCEDVRSLSAEQKAYYIRVFNITSAQQERIRQACYEPRLRRAAVSMKEPTGRFGHVEGDARAGQ